MSGPMSCPVVYAASSFRCEVAEDLGKHIKLSGLEGERSIAKKGIRLDPDSGVVWVACDSSFTLLCRISVISWGSLRYREFPDASACQSGF